MATKEDVRRILEDALKMERQAELNADEIMRELAINGFHDAIEHIRNDEIHHQQMVKELLALL